jgi:hypothetical protein
MAVIIGDEVRGGGAGVKRGFVLWPSSAEERTCVEDVEVNYSTVRLLRLILWKWYVRSWSGFIWHWLGAGGGILCKL